MERLGLFSKVFLVLFLTNTFQSSNGYEFHQMTNNSKLTIGKETFYPGTMLDVNENVAIYRSINGREIIKILHPDFDVGRSQLFNNEIFILKKLRKHFFGDPTRYGIVRLIASGECLLRHTYIIDMRVQCTAIVHTYGEPLFPILRQCVLSNDRKKLFQYFSQMALSMYYIEFLGKVFHNNINPSVFRLTDGKVVLDNFEIARSVTNPYDTFIYVDSNGVPIGFKPTMSSKAMKSEKRVRDCQRYSFEMTSYYLTHEKLPWQMDAIEFLWKENMVEAREITLILREIDLADYFMLDDLIHNLIHPKILSVIKSHGTNYRVMSAEFDRLST